MEPLLVGVDVGTASARAGVVSAGGDILGCGECPFDMNRPLADHAEHDSEEIWRAVCCAVRDAMARARVEPDQVRAIGFDATCSLVVRDQEGSPVPISLSGEARWDTIAWLDHRAVAEAQECDATAHPFLAYSGGSMWPEMQAPKLLWLKRRLPEMWQRTGLLFDLADFLTWRASGSLQRSRCTLGCKWPYLAHTLPKWQHDFLRSMQLEDLAVRGRLPEEGFPVGTDLGSLTAGAAVELGLSTRCRVAAGLIDAHAGALAMLGAAGADAGHQLCLIAGTSNCIMSMKPEAEPARGFWGPYYDAVLPGLWLSEGGQSATGALLDHLIRTFCGGVEQLTPTHDQIVARVTDLRTREGHDFAAGLHVLPDFLGNRSPFANPRPAGVLSGLALDGSRDGFCRLYWRACVGIALGVRLILEKLDQQEYDGTTLHVAGGHVRNPLLMELYADATGCRLVEHGARDASLRGAAIAASLAAGLYDSLPEAARAMEHSGPERRPNPGTAHLYDRDYRIFKLMHAHRTAIESID